MSQSCPVALTIGFITALMICPRAHAQYEPGSYWNAPDRGENAMRIRPGARTPDLTPETLLADWTAAQVERWTQEHPDWEPAAAARQYALASPTDAELQADFPRHVAPFARVRSGEPDRNARENAMFSYCPFCRSRTMSLTFDGDNPFGHAVTNCCPMVGHGNTPWYNGMSLWFPAHGKTFEIARVNEVGGGFGGDTVEVRGDVNLAAEGIEVGDWYVIHAIRPGPQVTVANDLCWREEPSETWRQYALRATGDVTVQTPAMGESSFCRLGTGAWQEAPRGRTSFPAAETGAQGASVIVGRPDWLNLADDRPPVPARIVLDGRQRTAEQADDLGWIDPPQTAEIAFRDSDNPIDAATLQVLLDGVPVGPEFMTAGAEDAGRTLRVQVDLAALRDADAPPRRHRLLLTVADRSIARHEASAEVSWIERLPLDEDVTYLSDLTPLRSFAHGGLILDRDYGGELSELGDRVYPKSVMICPEPGAQGIFGEVVYALPEEARDSTLLADIGIENMTAGRGSVVFGVQTSDAPEGPWHTLYESPVMRGGQPLESIEVALGGAAFLRLFTTDAGDGINSDHALWGNARLK